VTPCSLVNRRHFGGNCSPCFQGSGIFRNVCVYVKQIFPDWVGYWKRMVASPLHLLHPNHFKVFLPSHFEITRFHYSDNKHHIQRRHRLSLFSPYLFIYLPIIIIIINIKDWTLWSVPSPELQLLSPTFLLSSNCSPSLWSVVTWFQRDSV